jgi:hypothetical protein
MRDGTGMKSDLWTLQFFISEEGVCEVRADFHDYSKMECTCSSWNSRRKCKHVRFVKKAIENNDGYFSIKLDAEAEDVIEESDGPEAFRKMLLKYATVEVLP